MPPPDDLKSVKSRLSAAVLKLPGVAGVGLPARGVTVYLEDDTPELRARVADAVSSLKLPVAVHWEVSGKFGQFSD
jgi:hypothetical protein